MRIKHSYAAFACVATAALVPASASSATGRSGTPPAGAEAFAIGLTDARHVRFGPDGVLYVAEGGIGSGQPDTACPPVDLMDTPDDLLAGFMRTWY